MTSPLPAVLKEIAEVAGEPAAIQFAAAVGGKRVYIPAKVTDRHWLVECVGRKAAEKICAHFTVDRRGVRVDVPLAAGGAYVSLRRAVAKRLHDLDKAGEAAGNQARSAGVTQRTVHRHRRVHRGDSKSFGGRQGKLF